MYSYEGKHPNALCNWCDNFDYDKRWCYTHQSVQRGSQYPKRCQYYVGPELTGAALRQLMELDLIE